MPGYEILSCETKHQKNTTFTPDNFRRSAWGGTRRFPQESPVRFHWQSCGIPSRIAWQDLAQKNAKRSPKEHPTRSPAEFPGGSPLVLIGTVIRPPKPLSNEGELAPRTPSQAATGIGARTAPGPTLQALGDPNVYHIGNPGYPFGDFQSGC